MTGSTFSGPLIAFGSSGLPGVPDYNPSISPSMFYGGTALLDPRAPYTYQTGQSDTSPVLGFLTASAIGVLDAIPSAINAANIAAAQVPVAGTPLALASVSGAGITAGVTPTNQATGVAVASALAIDGVPNQLVQGSGGPYRLWDPSSLLARNVRVTSVGNDSGATFLVSGLDIYGYPMSELITGSNAGVASGRKAFKYILSVLPNGTLSGSNVSVGTGDVYGLPMLTASFPYLDVYYNGALVTSATGFTVPDPTNPATSTTGDVRGTYALQTPSNGTNRLQVFLTLAPANVSSVAGLFGVGQS